MTLFGLSLKFDLNLDNTNCTITLRVFEGKGKPYLSRNKAYKRSDTSVVEVVRTELNRLILEGTNQSVDSLASRQKDFIFKILEQKLVEEDRQLDERYFKNSKSIFRYSW